MHTLLEGQQDIQIDILKNRIMQQSLINTPDDSVKAEVKVK